MNLDDINESTFYTAEFVDNERVMVNVIWKDPLTLEQKNTIININDKIEIGKDKGKPHPIVTKLWSLIDLDTLHENTYQRIKRDEAAFREFAIRCGKEEGLLIDPVAYYDAESNSAKVDTKFYSYGLKLFFNDFDADKQKEDLFIVKLGAFELDLVRECQESELKSKLRKAKTPIEILEILLEIKKSS